MRGDIIKLAKEFGATFANSHQRRICIFDDTMLEHLHALATAPLQEQIAAQQARIKELVEAIKGIQGCYMDPARIKEIVERTDDLRALKAAREHSYEKGMADGRISILRSCDGIAAQLEYLAKLLRPKT